MKQPIKIAICGKKNTGKNTLSKLIYKELESRVIDVKMRGFIFPKDSAFITHIMAFADPIKEMILSMFPQAKRECLFGSSDLREEVIPNAVNFEGEPLTHRQALIDLGTMARRYNRNVWVDNFDNRVKRIENEANLIICSDLRFVEEMEYLKKNDYTIIKLLRDSITHSNNPTETVQDTIPSDQFDFVIKNNGTMKDLQVRALEILSVKY